MAPQNEEILKETGSIISLQVTVVTVVYNLALKRNSSCGRMAEPESQTFSFAIAEEIIVTLAGISPKAFSVRH